MHACRECRVNDTCKDEIATILERGDQEALLRLAYARTTRVLRYLSGRLCSTSEEEKRRARIRNRTRYNPLVASLYVHIPFCERKCLYCDFFSVEGSGVAEDFLGALRREISLQADYGSRAVFETIFLGGGTPSLLEPRQLESILSQLRATFQIRPDAEVTLEANPGTVTGETLRMFGSLGIYRLSIGIQSFHDRELKALGRIHDRAEALQCIELSRAAGFDNISIDLIYSISGQTLAEWEDNLRIGIALAPQHIAAYSLTLEDGTSLARMVRAGEVRMNPADLEADMYRRAMELLENHGYEHYEVSNYARPGFRCRHNCNYWSHDSYLGFGPSAHSFWKAEDGPSGRRWWNDAELASYMERLTGGSLPVASEEHVGLAEMLIERIFLSLRSGGLDLARLKLDFGYDLQLHQGTSVQWLLEEKMAFLEGGVLRLTSKGYPLCDEICGRLFQ
jgi:oxygen-independent coproporphyrinogen III oxidase